ncbi:MAG: hypothetical protein R2769_03905 [Saprospiraceae bacterium]
MILRLSLDGFIFNNENISVRLYEDANGNEVFDFGENNETIILSAGTGNQVNLSFNSSQEFMSLCQLRLEIDSTGLPTCEVYDFEITGPEIITTQSQSICLGTVQLPWFLNKF